MKVAVLAGGQSSEHDVSIESGKAVLDGLEGVGHEVEPVVIGRDGIWRQCDPRSSDGGKGRPVALVPGGGSGAFLCIDDGGDDQEGIDVVFPVLHGPYGEDGTVQGLLEIASLPYVGSGVLASSLCMDKAAFKQLIAQAGLPQPDCVVATDGDWHEQQAQVRKSVEELGYPVFVKPARLGSSVGISKVIDASELEGALTAALSHGPKAVVEEAIDGKEVECSVIGNDNPVASLPGEIKAHAEWYDYQAKYGEGGMELIVPAPIDEGQKESVRSLAEQAYLHCGCEGMARVDFFITAAGEVLISEINTIPGFTKTSVFAKLFEASGVNYEELLGKLLDLALQRHQAALQYQH